MKAKLSLLLCVICFLRPSCGYMRAISKESFPFIVDLNKGTKFVWNRGRVAELLSSSKAVSISLAGVYFLHRSQHVLQDTLDGECTRAEDCLCNSSTGVRVFPIFDSRVVFGQEGSLCESSESGRTLVFSGFSDITLCDIENNGHNVILTVDGGFVHSATRMDRVASIALTVLQVVVVAFIVHKISWSGKRENGARIWRMRTSYFVVLVAFSSFLLAACTSGPYGVYVSVEDAASLLYLSFYVFFHIGCFFLRDAEPSLGLLLGSLVLLFFRSFSTLNNPSIFLCLLFVGYMSFVKTMKKNPTGLAYIDCVLDGFLLGILIAFGVYPQYECVYEMWGHMLLLFCGIISFHLLYVDRSIFASEL